MVQRRSSSRSRDAPTISSTANVSSSSSSSSTLRSRRSRRRANDTIVEADEYDEDEEDGDISPQNDEAGEIRDNEASEAAEGNGGEDDDDDEEEEEDYDGQEEITRCICGHQEVPAQTIKNSKVPVDAGLFIQCDKCHVWQHGFCVGFSSEEEVPDVYACEKCNPERHLIVVRPGGKTSTYYADGAPDSAFEGGMAQKSAVSTPTSIDKKREKKQDKSKAGDMAGNSNNYSGSSTSSKTAATDAGADADGEDEEDDDGEEEEEAPKHERNVKDEDSRTRASKNHGGPNDSLTTGGSGHRSSRNAPASPMTEKESREHRRRITMNSRDAAYEETLKRVLEESTHDLEPKPKAEKEDQQGDDNLEEADSTTTNNNKDDDQSDGKKRKSPEPDDRAVKRARRTPRSRKTSDDDTKSGRGGTPVPSASTVLAQDHYDTSNNNSTATGGNNSAGATTPSKRKRSKPAKRSTKDSKKSSSAAHSSQNQTTESKPRIPPPRASMNELQQRVAAILEFVGRTQTDALNEQQDRKQLLEERNQRFQLLFPDAQEDQSKFQPMFDKYEVNISKLEELNSKLMRWEELYGAYSNDL